MNQESEYADMEEDAEAPAPAYTVRVNRYGSVAGLDDEELADPEELERQVMLREWGPVLMLPVKGERSSIRPAIGEDGRMDWGAFGTIDFDRTRPVFDGMRYKVERLKEQLGDVLIMLSIVKERLPRQAALVIKYLRMGLIAEAHVTNEDVLVLAKLTRRAEHLQEEIARLREASKAKRQREAAWLTA